VVARLSALREGPVAYTADQALEFAGDCDELESVDGV
jgi:hypothetical protein